MQNEGQCLNQIQKMNMLIYNNPIIKSVHKKLFHKFIQIRINFYKQYDVSSIKSKMLQLKDLNILSKEQYKKYQNFIIVLLLGPSAQYLSKQTYQMDIISHFGCRLIYSKNTDLKNKFINYQKRIFQNRIRFMTGKIKQKLFYELNKIQYKQLSINQFQKIKKQIDIIYNDKVNKCNQILKLNFRNVKNLVAKRKCFLLKGFAYVRKDFLQIQIIGLYENHLKIKLQLASEKIQYLKFNQYNQYTQFFDYWANNESKINYCYLSKQGSLSIKNIDFWALNAFPPCMYYLYKNLKKKHHLKNQSRLILCAFLKGAGLKFEDSNYFWSKQFTDYQKKFSYNMKWVYGKEGKRQQLTPYQCQSLIKMPPKIGQDCGCLFRKLHSQQIINLYEEQNVYINRNQYHKIAQYSKEQHYQLACTYFFNVRYKGINQQKLRKVGNHPNSYFSCSFQYLSQNQPKNDVIQQKMQQS